MTEEEFCQYENGSEILDAVKECGNVEEIYYFADGRMIVNYVEDGVILDELYGGMGIISRFSGRNLHSIRFTNPRLNITGKDILGDFN